MITILVTGSAGQLGNELLIASKRYYGYEFIFTDLDKLDITLAGKTSKFIKSEKPDWIINCAAYTAVDKAESEKEKAFLVNSSGVENIVNSIRGTECKLIHISTDYVYIGKSNVPVSESDELGPVSIYGKSKLAGEKLALLHPETLVIRTSWLYSSFGNNFVKTILKLSHEKEFLKVVFDQVGTPTYAADLAAAILSIISGVIKNQTAFIPGIYNYSNEGVCSWYDFAVAIKEESGSLCNILPVLTEEYILPAQRPFYSVLNKKKIKETYNIKIPYWRESLNECIKLLK
jgi:dTDP-4-dehydrorhamnose reductase